METYRHGSYGKLGNDILADVSELEAGVVYIGTAPINLVKGFSKENINKPVKIRNIREAKSILGYSDNWEQYTLCEVFKAHFGNESGNIGPIICINVLDPSINIASQEKSGSVTFKNKKAIISDDLMIVDSFSLEGKTEGTDYSVEYDMDKGQLVIQDISAAGISTNTYKYSQINMPFENMKKAVIGSKSTETGQVTGIEALKLVYQTNNDIPKKVLAPSFSSFKDVNEKIKAVARSINGRFIAQDYADIPLVDEEGTAIDTKAKAEKWAEENGYDSEFSKNFYPMAVKNGKKYHISTLFAVRQMRVDKERDGIPYETASNKDIDIDGLFFGDSAINSGFDIEDANELNSFGITTAIYSGGNWKLWGGHTSAYKHSKEDEQGKEIFDTSVAMQLYLADNFILRNDKDIDKPMQNGLLQSIIVEEQNKLDNLVSIGALIGSPKFVVDDMSISEIKQGGYSWVLNDTPTPQFKSGTVKVVYTDEGFATLLGGATDE